MTPGTDFALARRITWVFPDVGPGRGFALATKNRLAVVPYFAIVGRRDLPLLGKPALEVLDATLARTPDELEAAIDEWVHHAIVRPLAAAQRIKIRTGFFTRSVAFSDKPSGFDRGAPNNGTVIGFRPSKEELAHFQQLFAGDPRLV